MTDDELAEAIMKSNERIARLKRVIGELDKL